MKTATDIYAQDRVAGPKTTDVLYVAFRAHEPLVLPSRIVVEQIDAIYFGRGDYAITRERRQGVRALVISVPDPLMSSRHGRLVHAAGSWVLDDPSSKNGAIVRGVKTRSCSIGVGDIFSLGHTLFFLSREQRGDDVAVDVQGDSLSAPLPELVTFDVSFAAALRRMAQIAATPLPVLLLGETGTGKEVTARALHQLSRRPGPFVAVNCGALTPTLVESELFGHRKGAFSGAVADKPGYVRTSDGGTLFLDEIAELPHPAQAALLRVLQQREVVPVGDATPIALDLRVCAATHRDLPAAVADGKFREDLYARLEGFTLTLPPLRARRGDLGILIASLLRRGAKPERVKFTPAAATRLFEYDWPRNVRELEKTLTIMTTLAGKDVIGVEHVPDGVGARALDREQTNLGEGATALTAEDQALKQTLERLLREHGNNLAEVARKLGKDRTQVYRWVRRFGIDRDGTS